MNVRHISPELSVFAALFGSVVEEMGTSYCMSSLSPNIKERQDYSCGLFDADGRMVAMAPHIPLHLGSMSVAVKTVLDLAPFAPGDVVILNDPYLSGTHLPDVTMVSPIFIDGRSTPAFFCVSRGHQADIGGSTPGSMGAARELIQEGMVIAPVRLYRGGQLVSDVLRLILANVRTPDERWGDLRAQAAAHSVAERRMRDLTARFGVDACARHMSELMHYTERMTRLAIAHITDGVYAFTDYLDDDGFTAERLPIRVCVAVRGEEMTVDFTGSSPLVDGPLNATPAVTASCVHYVVRCLLPREVPANDGSTRPITIVLPAGSIVAAEPPHAVAGSIETAQRVADALLGALAQALPAKIPAASQGSMSSITFGGQDTIRGRPFTYYETVAGGAGGSPLHEGASVLHAHMTNTLNTPVEVLEMTYPLRVLEYSIRRGTGGRGQHSGGCGARRVWQVLVPCSCSLLGDRRITRPWGVGGGEPGTAGRDVLIRRDTTMPLRSKGTIHLEAGDIVSMDTAGGGGWGAPEH